jgi:catechol 2,3-dioxygenase-like lactoylglutathione lyase family enzyme
MSDHPYFIQKLCLNETAFNSGSKHMPMRLARLRRIGATKTGSLHAKTCLAIQLSIDAFRTHFIHNRRRHDRCALCGREATNMEIRKLDHVGIRVMDFGRTIRFYEKLGFKSTRIDHNEHVAVIRHPGGLELNLLDSGNDNYGGRNILMDAEARYPGYTHYAIEVRSVNDARIFLESINMVITQGPVTFGDGKTSIFIRDPDFNVIEFTELPKP